VSLLSTALRKACSSGQLDGAPKGLLLRAALRAGATEVVEAHCVRGRRLVGAQRRCREQDPKASEHTCSSSNRHGGDSISQRFRDPGIFEKSADH